MIDPLYPENRCAASERRPVASFVRHGRLTPAQRRALSDLLPRYRLDPARFVPGEAFQREAPIVVEVGFGNGEALVASAQAHPDWNHVGVEVHAPGIGHLCLALAGAAIDNVRIVDGDAVVWLAGCPNGSLDELRVWFPDPWPKARHHKRRLIQPAFVALAARKLRGNGILHLATDWAPYAEQMREVVAGQPAFVALAGAGARERPPTRFARRGEALGQPAIDLCYRRKNETA